MTGWRSPDTAPKDGWVLALLSEDLWGNRVWPVLYQDGRLFQIGMIFAFDKPDAEILKIRDIPADD